MKYDDYVEKFDFWDKISPTDKNILKSNMIIKRYIKGANVDNTNDRSLGLIILISGKLRVYMESCEGKEVTLFKLLPLDSWILSSSCRLELVRFKTKVIAEEDSILLAVSASCIEKLIKNNVQVMASVYATLTQRFSDVMNLFEEMLFDKFYKRLAKYIIYKYSKIGTTKIPINRTDVAKNMNSAREVVSRNIKILEDEKVIKMDRSTLIITDIKKLKEISESY